MFTKLIRAISLRLSVIRCRRAASPFGKLSVKLHAWSSKAGDDLKEAFLICKYWLSIQWLRLRMALSPEGLKLLPAVLRGLRKSGVLASLVLLSLILFMGHSATVAWLTYTTPATRNTFQVGQMDLAVSYRNDKTNGFTPLTQDSAVFNDEALYEPGYTQVIYFHVENKGTVPFDYGFSVRSYQSDKSTNVYGRSFDLADYLYFGMVTAPTLQELEAKLATRQDAEVLAQELASYKLGSYTKDGSRLNVGGNEYAALVIHMPRFVDNEANHNGTPPKITLGVVITTQQRRN